MLKASDSVVYLTPLDFGGVGDALLLLGSRPSSWRTCILGTDLSSSPVGRSRKVIPLEVFISWLRVYNGTCNTGIFTYDSM